MKKLFVTLLAGVFVIGLFSLVHAGKPTRPTGEYYCPYNDTTYGDSNVCDEACVDTDCIPGSYYIGNGYPSGPHFNLNIHGKKDTYDCSPQTYQCDLDLSVEYSSDNCDGQCGGGNCFQVFGNVINVPYYANTFQILMESGRKGPKGKPGATELEVTDSCAGFTGDGEASFRLPKNEEGYAVYVKITGKPGKNPEETYARFTSPDFKYVEDELANNLIYLGQIIGTSIATLTDDEIIIYRNEAPKGKKVSKATDISKLFSYSGDVCYVYDINNEFDYCIDANAPAPSCTEDSTGTYEKCCTYELCCDSQTIVAPVPDETPGTVCEFFADVAVDYGDGNGDVCPNISTVDPYLQYLIDVDCRSYTDEWVFNIADFVGMLWDIENHNSYNIKLRFYPLPLN